MTSQIERLTLSWVERPLFPVNIHFGTRHPDQQELGVSVTWKEIESDNPEGLYSQVHTHLAALLEGETDLLANMANTAALLFHSLPQINWAGFYLLRGTDLVLGPFQGKPACTRIAEGRGVCGAAAQRRETVVVADVHEFPGHIACDAASRSEIVVPIIHQGRLLGVLDIDSPQLARFTETDSRELQRIVETLLAGSDVNAPADA